MKRIFLTEDHAVFRAALALMLEREPHFEVTAQAGADEVLGRDISFASVMDTVRRLAER